MRINHEDLRTDNIEECIFWIDGNLHILLKDKELVLPNAYCSSITYEGIDIECNENVAMVGNNKKWK